jgi:hypothetical protein
VLSGECNGHTNIDGKYVRGVVELSRINAAVILKIYTSICLCNMQNGEGIVLCVLAVGID